MELKELLAELLKLDRAAVVTALQAEAHAIYQAVFDKGHSTATAAARAEKERIEGVVAGLQTQLEQRDKTIKELQDKAPDVATVRAQFEQQILKLQADHKDALKAKDEEIQGERRARTFGDLRTKLISKGVDPDYADVLTGKAEVQKRVRFNKAGEAEVLQADSEVPLQAGKGQTAIDLFADELQKATPAKFLTSNGDRGSGTENGTGTSGKSGNLYEGIRKRATERQTKQGEGTKTAAEKLGIK